MNTYKLTIIAILASLAVVGRFAFQYVPNVQPVTTIIIICGFFLGPSTAAILALLTTYLSNLLLGMGIWTIWQIIAWMLIGVVSGLLGKWRIKYPLYVLVVFSIFSGYIYGLIISLTNYTITGQFIPYYLAGLLYDTFHAVGNGMFMIVLYPVLAKVFKMYQGHEFYRKIPTKK